MFLNASIANKEFQSAKQGEKSEELIEKLINTDHHSWESRLHVTDVFIDPDQVDEEDEFDAEWLPNHEVTLAVDSEAGYGAIRWVDVAEEGRLCVTLNQESSPDVDLLIDGGCPHFFPHSAALPIAEVRKALQEFTRTGDRPECVNWQDFDRA